MNEKIKLFVPGRLCLFGEHSDWASGYRNINKEINKGYALVKCLDLGFYATANKSKVFKIIDGSNEFVCDMNLETLKKEIDKKGYYSYVCGVAYQMLFNYGVGGIEIVITNKDLPEKKGLSSSAAICVLVARAFNLVYDLKLDINTEIDIAYAGERYTSSCGKMDFICAYGKGLYLMEFDGDFLKVTDLDINSNMFLVYADVNSKKDTIKILTDLNRCFPHYKNDLEKSVHTILGKENEKIIFKALECLRNKNSNDLGRLMTESLNNFDQLIPICDEFKAPKLHGILNDEFVKENSLGGKGVGSGGDGSVQLLVLNKHKQLIIKKYLEEEYGCTAYLINI